MSIEIPEIARRLNVAYVLEGSVRKAGEQVRITAQLIEAHSDTHMWSHTYDRTLKDIFVIQDEIAATVVDELKLTLLGGAPIVAETHPEAYALQLRARHLGNNVSEETMAQAVVLLRKALELDPNYAVAWNSLAHVYSIQAGRGLIPPEEGYVMAREALDRALRIDPGYAAAHANLGWLTMSEDLAVSAIHIKRALELEPANPSGIRYAAILLRNLGRIEEAIGLDEYAVARDPVNPIGFSNLGFKYLYVGRWGEAIDAFSTALQISPGYIGAHYYIGVALMQSGQPEKALGVMHKERFEAFRQLGLAMTYHALGQFNDSNRELSNLIQAYERDAAYNIAYVMAFRGEVDRAFEWLQKAVEYGDPGLSEIPGWPLFDNIRDDPRWLPFLKSVGYAPDQLESIEFFIDAPR